jgi:SRF-type transcription factor (DNA-binding and dimerisation domain)
MGNNNLKRKQENLRRRKKTLVKKVYEFGKDFDFEVALILSKNGRYFTFRSLDQDTWPPSMEQIVSQYHPCKLPTKLRSKQQLSYPIPTNLLPRDIEGNQSSVE